MPTRTLYADATSGQLMIADYSVTQANNLANAAADPDSYLDNLRFHTGLDYIQLLGSVTYANLQFSSFTRDTLTYDQSGKKSGSTTFYIPTQEVQTATVGTYSSSLDTPTLAMVGYNSSIWAGGFSIDSSTAGQWHRKFFPAFNTSTRVVNLVCQAVALNTDMPSQTLSSVTVYLVG